ncbi:hypothetical protein ACD578_28705 (plasmid) [Microvirga sp. RSM25]|uniref:hypothetical protein n=1 Tax=Microvirga sp. RSM25 TaxID=3273802 RepID=UPI00384D0CAD
MTVWAWTDAVFTWIAGKAPVGTAGAAVVDADIAVKGYHKWLPETVGKRKIELAEDVLADFHQVRDIIAWARNPGGFGGEGGTRLSAEGEDPDEKSMKDSYHRTRERLHAEAEVFSRLQSKKYRAIAYFGPDGAKPFQDLKENRSCCPRKIGQDHPGLREAMNSRGER